MNARVYLLMTLFIMTRTFMTNAQDSHLVVVIPSYNNEQFCLKNLDAVFKQNYSNFHVIYIDDCSSDATVQLVEQYIRAHHVENQITVIKNTVRCGALRNIYMAVHQYCNDNDVVALYDGDDWLATEQALEIVNKAYQDPTIWTTYGNFYSTRHGAIAWCRPFEQRVIQNRSYRTSEWRFGHLRTAYAWLFKRIELKDFLYEGSFYQMAWDQAIAHPMLEMADGRCKFISEILYIYNEGNPINDWNVNGRLQHQLRDIILAKKKYEPLAEKPTSSTKEFSVYTMHLPLDKEAALLNDDILQNYDMCLFVNAETQSNLMHQNITQHAQLLHDMKGTIVVYATYESTTQPCREIRYSSYLWDTIFTFQLGWKPELPYQHKEYAWLVPTSVYKENSSYVTNMLNKCSSHTTSKKLAMEAGLLIINGM